MAQTFADKLRNDGNTKGRAPAYRLSVGNLDERDESPRQPLEYSGEFEHFEDELIQRLHDAVIRHIIVNRSFTQFSAAAAAARRTK